MAGIKSDNPIYDPLGIEIFAIDETFESVFNGLKGVYFRLYYKESKRPRGLRNLQKEKTFYKRFGEIGKLKRSYRYNDWEAKREAVDIYAIELRQMVNIELSEYNTFENSNKI